jgi:hypothetical protein
MTTPTEHRLAITSMKTAIDTIREALEASISGLDWYKQNEPDLWNESDEEHIALINAALTALKSLEGQEVANKPLVWMRMSDHKFVSDRIKNDGEKTFQDFRVPLYAHPPSNPSEPRLTVDEAMEVVERWYAELGIVDMKGVAAADDLRARLTQSAKP